MPWPRRWPAGRVGPSGPMVSSAGTSSRTGRPGSTWADEPEGRSVLPQASPGRQDALRCLGLVRLGAIALCRSWRIPITPRPATSSYPTPIPFPRCPGSNASTRLELTVADDPAAGSWSSSLRLGARPSPGRRRASARAGRIENPCPAGPSSRGGRALFSPLRGGNKPPRRSAALGKPSRKPRPRPAG